MGEIIRSQPSCYYATPEHLSSVWGRYAYIYSGKGMLILTDETLALRGKALELDIPLKSIKGIGVETYSSWAKPMGLARLAVHYHRDDWTDTIYLIPAESPLAPTWETSKLVEDWYGTLSTVDALAGRMEPLPENLPSRPTAARFALLMAIVGLPALLGAGLMFLLTMA